MYIRVIVIKIFVSISVVSPIFSQRQSHLEKQRNFQYPEIVSNLFWPDE